MLTLLDEREPPWFPDPDLSDDHGLVAVSEKLGPERIKLAYQKGIFPWMKMDYDPHFWCWFSPHPRMVLQPDISMHLIQTIEEREQVLGKTGLDYLVIHPFSSDFSRLSAEDYVKTILVDRLNTKKVVVGYDHRFGRNRTASLEEMHHYGAIYDFEVIEIDAKKINVTAVSSTKIRKAIDKGDMATTNQYLGHPFTLNGMVIHGDKRGRSRRVASGSSFAG